MTMMGCHIGFRDLLGLFSSADCGVLGRGPTKCPILPRRCSFGSFFLLNGHLFGLACICDGEPGGSELWRWKGGRGSALGLGLSGAHSGQSLTGSEPLSTWLFAP